MSRLSLCVIARDEEAMLPGLFASVGGAVDEVVLVDTGSTDRTVDVARAAGARVVQATWCGDFAAARNASIAAASGDWLLVLDADERLAPGAAGVLRKAIADPRLRAALLRCHNAACIDAATADVLSGKLRIGEPTLQVRLARREPDLAFDGSVHENVDAWLTRNGIRPLLLHADFVHLGNAPEVRAARGKASRNLAILRARLASDPGDLVAWGYVAIELVEARDGRGAAVAAEAGWRHAKPGAPGLHRLAVARAWTALSAGSPEVALATVEQAGRIDRPRLDYAYLEGKALDALAALEQDPLRQRTLRSSAARAYQAALGALERVEVEHLVVEATERTIATQLGQALLLAGRGAEAVAAFDRALAAER